MMMNKVKSTTKELERLQIMYEQTYKKCSQSIKKVFKDIKEIKDLEQIYDIAEYQVQTIENDDLNYHMRQVIKKDLINDQVNDLINKIEELWIGEAKDVLKESFRVDLQGLINQIKNNGYQNPDFWLVKVELRKQSKKLKNNKNLSQDNQYRYTNSFMCTLSQIFQKYISETFVNYKLNIKYPTQRDHIIKQVDIEIYNTFKSRFSELHKQQQQTLNEQQEYTQIYLKEDIIKKELSQMKKEEFYTQKENGNNLRLLITHSFQEALNSKFKVKETPFYLIIEQQVKNCEDQAKKIYEELFLARKDQMMEDYRKEFAKIMDFIFQNYLFIIPFKQNNIEKDIFYLIINCATVRNENERKIFLSLISYLQTLDILDGSQNNLINELQKMSILQIKNLKKDQFQVKENSKNFLQYLQSFIKDNSFNYHLYVLLCQIYMLATNIQVKKVNNKVFIDILPYYGYFYDLKSRIADYLCEELKSIVAPLFFNFLDSYFEDNQILQNNQVQQSFLAKYKEKNNSDGPSIIDLLRRNFDYPINYFSQLQNAFYQKFSLIKHDLGIEIPQEFYLVRISPPNIRSRNVIIAISGFTSEKEDKQIKWKKLSKVYPNCEIFALQYKSKTEEDLKKELTELIESFFLPIKKIVKDILATINITDENIFDKATKEAIACGRFLAHLIQKGYFLPNSSISLIGFSLGTHVIQEFLTEYKSLLENSNTTDSNSVIASIVLMGGVASTKIIEKKKLIEVVSYKLFNCYSKKDGILSYIYRLNNNFSNKKPAGLGKITYEKYDDKNKTVNNDFTSTISAHDEYMKKYDEILQKIDFRQEFVKNSKIELIISNHLLQNNQKS